MPPKTKATRKAPAKGRVGKESFTLVPEEDMQFSVHELCSNIKQGTLDPKDLTDVQLDACIEYLKYELGHTHLEIAEFLKRHRNTISTHCKVIEDRQAKALAEKGIDKFKIAFRLYTVTEMVMANARKKGDYRLMMDAYHKMIEKYQSLGVLYEAPKKHEVSGEVEHRHKMLIGHAIELIQQHPEGDRDKLVRLFAERYGKRPPVQS